MNRPGCTTCWVLVQFHGTRRPKIDRIWSISYLKKVSVCHIPC